MSELKTRPDEYGVTWTILPIFCLRDSKLFEHRGRTYAVYASTDIRCPHCGYSDENDDDWGDWHVIDPSQPLLSRLLMGVLTNGD